MDLLILLFLLVTAVLLYFILRRLKELFKFVEAINICFGLQSFSKTLYWPESRPGKKLNRENKEK